MNYQRSVQNAFYQRQSLIIIGLTGKTGSGCSTVASILHKADFLDLDIKNPKQRDYCNKTEREDEIIYNYMCAEGRWSPFTIIEGSSVILSFLVEMGIDKLISYFERIRDNPGNIRISAIDELIKSIGELKASFDESSAGIRKIYNIENMKKEDNEIRELYSLFLETLPGIKKDFMRILSQHTCFQTEKDLHSSRSHLYTYLMQEFGNNIRSSGDPYSSEYSEDKYYTVAQRIDQIIALISYYNELGAIRQTRICIDAIRNPYEAYYFKDKYSAFYLVSVNTEKEERFRRLAEFNIMEIENLDEIESEQADTSNYSMFYHQDMRECLSISDIHVYNPRQDDKKFYFLTTQIVRYVCLMLHPGLVKPTHIEHCMQTAYIARLNSGCLSRQVGAAITGPDFSIKAIGWNDVPESQTPCNLRSIPNYCVNRDIDTFSSYELKNKQFQVALQHINEKIRQTDLYGLPYAYCFKDIINGIKSSKNQVYTRSLHAEENAFLQLAKNGGQGIRGGKLFTTASPCELCAKKAFQLGIREIYYIDPYPGISFEHILNCGTGSRPTMNLFYGAIGDAFIKLYLARIPLKDEISLLSGINTNDAIKEAFNGVSFKNSIDDFKYTLVNATFILRNKTCYTDITHFQLEALKDNVSEFYTNVIWTGSAFKGFKIIESNRDCSFRVIDNGDLHTAIVSFKTPLIQGEQACFTIETEAVDSLEIMQPFYSQEILRKTEKLSISVMAQKGLIASAYKTVYAKPDMDANYCVEKENMVINNEGEQDIITYSTENPLLLYSYCIEWEYNRIR